MNTYMMYFDESGTDIHNSDVFVAGCMMKKEDWLALEVGWKSILDSVGIKRFRASSCNAGKKDFAGWKPEQKQDLFDSLIREVNKCDVMVGFSTLLKIELTDTLRYFYPGFDISPYEACVLRCHEIAAYAPNVLNKGGTIGLYFEAGQDFRMPYRDLIIKPWRGSAWETTTVAWHPKELNIPYQVADLFAWEFSKQKKEAGQLTAEPKRQELKAFVASKKRRILYSHMTGRDLRLHLDRVWGMLNPPL